MKALRIILFVLPVLLATNLANGQQQVVAIDLDTATNTETSQAKSQHPNETETVPVTATYEDSSTYDSLQISGKTQNGIASWYGPGFHGRRTASGSRFDMHGISVAHRTLPLLSYVRITLAETGAQIVAQVTDRGPYAKGRIVDLSKGAAQALGMIGKGLAQVMVEPVIER